MGLNLSGIGQLLRRGADDIGSAITGQDWHSAPTPQQQAPQPPPQQSWHAPMVAPQQQNPMQGGQQPPTLPFNQPGATPFHIGLPGVNQNNTTPPPSTAISFRPHNNTVSFSAPQPASNIKLPSAQPQGMPLVNNEPASLPHTSNILSFQPQDYQNAFKGIDSYNPDDQIKLLSHAAANGYIDHSKASDIINQLNNYRSSQIKPDYSVAENTLHGLFAPVQKIGQNLVTDVQAATGNKAAQHSLATDVRAGLSPQNLAMGAESGAGAALKSGLDAGANIAAKGAVKVPDILATLGHPLGEDGKGLISLNDSVIPTIKNIVNKASDTANNAFETPVTRANLADQAALHDYTDYLSGAYNPSGAPGGLNAVINSGDTALAKHLGVDPGTVRGMNVADKVNAINGVLDNLGKQRTAIQQGGYAKNPLAGAEPDPLASLKQEALKYKSADEFTQALQDGKVPIPKGTPEQIGAIQKQLGMNWDKAYNTPGGVEAMQRKVVTDLYNQAHAEAKTTVEPSTSPKLPQSGEGELPPQPKQIKIAAKQDGVSLPQDSALPRSQQSGLALEKPSAPRNADAERIVINDLQNGIHPDDVLSHYMNNTGKDLQSAAHDVGRVARESNLGRDITQNPLRGQVDLGHVGIGDHAQAELNGDFVHKQETSAGVKALESYRNLHPDDQVLLKDIETKPVNEVAASAKNPRDFTKAVTDIQNYYNLRDAWDSRLGIQHNYRVNYLRQIFDKAEQAPPEARSIGSGKKPGYTMARTKETLGTNVGDALERDVKGASFNHAKLAYEEGLHNAYGHDAIAKGEIKQAPEGGNYTQLRTKYGKDLTASPEIAEKINSRAPATESKGVMKAVDTANATAKYLKLGGGTFHAFTEALNYFGTRLADTLTGAVKGEVRLHPTRDAKVVASMLSKKVASASMEDFDKVHPGQQFSPLEKAHLSGVTLSAKELVGDIDSKLIDKIKDGKYNPIAAVHRAVFEREIPMAKMTLFDEKTRNLDPRVPEQMAEIRSAANGVNHIFGGLDRAHDTHVLSPQSAKVASRFLLATDFTEAKFNTLFDALTAKGPQGSLARQAVIGKTLVAGGIGVISLAATGQLATNDPKKLSKQIAEQALDPHIVTTIKHKGVVSIAKTPETYVSEIGRLITPLFQPGDKAANEGTAIQHYVAGRASAGISTATQLASNKDYSQHPIFVRDQAGNLQIGKTATNVGLQIAPQPVYNAIKVKQGVETPGEATLNTAGFRVAKDPNDTNNVGTQQFYQNQKQNQKDIQTGNFKAIDPALSGLDPKYAAYWASQLKAYQALNPGKDMNGVENSGAWNGMSQQQKASFLLMNDQTGSKTPGAQELSPIYYINLHNAQADPSRPHSPLYDLSGKDGVGFTIDGSGSIQPTTTLPKAQVALDYQSRSATDDQKPLILAANPWLSDYEKQVGQYSQNYQPNMTAFMQKQGYTQPEIDQFWQQHPSSPAPFTNQVTPDQQKLIDSYYAIADPTEKAQFFQDNAKELGLAFAADTTYKNQRAVAQGALPDQLHPTPNVNAAAGLAQLQKNPNHDKAIGKANALLIQNNPDLNQYLADSGIYNLAKDAARYQFQDPAHPGLNAGQLLNLGRPIDQSTLGSISNVAKYDIGKDANGKYSFMGAGGTGKLADGATSGGGYKNGKYVKFAKHQKAPRMKIHRIGAFHQRHEKRAHAFHIAAPSNNVQYKNKGAYALHNADSNRHNLKESTIAIKRLG